MREILFRGKRADNGEWVEGWFCGGTCIHPFAKTVKSSQIIDKDLFWHEVISETVGQYTGLTDKNGNRIFEGDVLSAHFDESYPDDETLLLVGNNGYAFTLKEEDSDPEMIDDSDIRLFDETFVVIGNETDNPELMEGE